MTYFAPANLRNHELAKQGKDVPDYCLRCGMDFMYHTNGACPQKCVDAMDPRIPEQEGENEQPS